MHFQAGVQYGDWKGTAAADEYGAGDNTFDELFEAAGDVDKKNELLIAFEFYAGEGYTFLRGYFHPKSDSTDGGWIPSLNHDFGRNTNPIRVRKVDVKITLDEFFKHFKRFDVVLVQSGLDIIGREYDITNE